MFKAGSNLKDKSPEEIFYQDYKKFIAEDEINFGVGQISSMDSDELAEIKERLVPFMVSECGRHGVTRVFFMLTNIIEESTELSIMVREVRKWHVLLSIWSQRMVYLI